MHLKRTVLFIFLLHSIISPILYSQDLLLKKHILFIDSYNPGYLWSEDLRKGISETLNLSSPIYDIDFEYMDTKQHNPNDLLQEIARLYEIKYSKKQPDVILSADNNALNFLKLYRDTLFPNVPVVFCGINNYSDVIIEDFQNTTGIAEQASFDKTLILALQLFPETERIYSIAGSAETTQIHIHELQEAADSLNSDVSFISLTNMTYEEFSLALIAIPANSLLVYLGLYKDTKGDTLSVQDSFSFIKKYTPVPIISMWNQNLPYCLGGVMISGVEQGRRASSMVLDVLSGTKADSIPILTESPNKPMFNYNELIQYKVPLDSLPEDTILINEPVPSFYSQYKLQIWGAFLSIFSLSLLSIALILAIHNKRKAYKELRKARNYIVNIIDSMPSVLIGVNPSYEITQWNKAAARFTGVNQDEALGKSLNKLDPTFKSILPAIQEAITTKKPGMDIRRPVYDGDDVKYEDVVIFPLIANGTDGPLSA